MNEVKIYGEVVTLERAGERLELNRNMLAALHNKQITPSRVIGRGHINPRRDAESYLNMMIGRYETLVAIMREGMVSIDDV